MKTSKKSTKPLGRAAQARGGHAGRKSLLAVVGLVAVALLTKAAIDRRSSH
jgi:hypothetical protein